MAMLTKKTLIEQLPEADTVLVHSSYKSLGGVEGGAETVIDALCEKYATVVLPTFNLHSWTEGHYFSLAETRSEMGIISELARKDSRFIRTRHPIYSFAVAGHKKGNYNIWSQQNNNSFGPSTVFDYLCEKKALMISIGLHWNNTFTMTHHAERLEEVDYRRQKIFAGIYVTQQEIELLAFGMMVRKPRVLTDIRQAMEKLVKWGTIKEIQIGDAVVHLARADKFVEAVIQVVKNNPYELHRIVEVPDAK